MKKTPFTIQSLLENQVLPKQAIEEKIFGRVPGSPVVPKPAEKKRSKYGNIKIETEDGWFDSKRELARWRELQLLERAGEITGLQRQVKYPFNCNTVIINNKEIKLPYQVFRFYKADFVYLKKFKEIVEDCKGMRTAAYKRQKLLMKLVYGIEILET